ncbi:hypothetical protein ACFCP7_10555 [Paenibacillus elgii]
MLEVETRTYEISGTPKQLDVLERVFGRIEELGNIGSSRTISIYVDGDGAVRMTARRNGEKLNHEDMRDGDARFETKVSGDVRADLG